MRRLALAVALAWLPGAAHAAPPGPAAAVTARPPRALPAIARRVLEDGAVVVTLAQPGTAEIVVVRAVALGTRELDDALAAAEIAFPHDAEAAARGVTIARIARDGVLLIVARGPAAELPLAVFTLGARPRAPTGDAALAAAADELRRAGAAWIVTGDTDTGRVTSLIERFVPASTAPARAVSSRPSRPASPADATGTRWTTPTSSVGADEALALAWFALAQRVGASAQVARGSGPPLLTMTLGAASSREADARLARARARLLRDGVSADEVDGFRRSREAAALSRTPEEWATRLALQELHDGDARRAGRELALVWEAGAAGVRRALLGPLAPARLQEQHPR